MSSRDGMAPDSPLSQGSEPSSGHAPPRILVVDDDLINQRVIANLLKRKGWESAVARSGQECLQKLSSEVFHLVLLDIQMPAMDGFQTAASLRRQEAERGRATPIPIVALTALRQPDTRERCLAAGMDDHLTKPVNTDQLYAVIQRVLKLPS